MAHHETQRRVVLGQPVHLRTDASARLGYIVAIMLVDPHEALVRWQDAEPTFEALDDLVDAPARPIEAPPGAGPRAFALAVEPDEA